jgi:sensor histidine kinase YesM
MQPSSSSRGSFWLGRDDHSVYGFLRRYLPFNVVLTTAIGLIITALFGSSADLWHNLTSSYCIGFTILLLNLALRVFLLPRFTAKPPFLLLPHVATIPLGFVIGMPIADRLTGQETENPLVGVMFSLIGGSFAILYVLNVERRRRAEQAERTAMSSQLQVLQAQVEPHFLFNTLASLDALLTTDTVAARALLGHLNRYLRASLIHARSDSATLETEFSLLSAYLAIMAMRLPHRLRYRVECDADCAQLVFPPMLVQPLVENAVTHGVEPAAEGGEISVQARRVADRLVVTVSDTGTGWGRSGAHGTGTGLANVRERLHALYGEAASVTTHAVEPHGAVVELSVPVRLLRNNRASGAEHKNVEHLLEGSKR